MPKKKKGIEREKEKREKKNIIEEDNEVINMEYKFTCIVNKYIKIQLVVNIPPLPSPPHLRSQ